MSRPTGHLLLDCPKPVRLPRRALISALLMVSLAACDDGSQIVSGPGGNLTDLPLTCEVEFYLEDEGRFENAFTYVFHDASLGTFGEAPECESPRLPPQATFHTHTCHPQEHCDETTRQLSLDLARYTLGLDRGFSGPRVLARCTFYAEHYPSAEDFDIEGTGTRDLDWNWNGDASVQVSSVTCVGAGSSTSTSSTSSTSLLQCEDARCSTGEVCVQNVCVDPDLYAIDFTLNDSVTLGALQFSIEVEDCLSGSFVALDGRGRPWCEIDFDPSVMSAGHISPCRLTLGMISISGVSGGFSGPTKIATCFFEGAMSPPSPGDFLITIEDASEPDTDPIVPFPTVSISDVRQITP